MTTKDQQQHHHHVLQEHNTGTSKEDNVGGHAPPPETIQAWHGEVRARAKIQRVGGSLKKKCKGFPLYTKNIMSAHVQCRWSLPCGHLRGEDKNTTARQTMRRRRDNWAQLGGNKWRIDDKISATTSSTCTTRTQHGDK